MVLLPYFFTTEEGDCMLAKANSGKAVFKWKSTVTSKTSPVTGDTLLFNPR